MNRRRLLAAGLGLLPLALFVGHATFRRAAAPRPRPSVVLVTLDTVRADRVGAWGGPAGLTPVLDGLARRGLVLEEAVASAPLTLPSHATILTGLEPPRHGVHDNGRHVLPSDVETLATRLKAAGYETGAVVGAYVLDRRFGLARGFDHYDDRIDRNEGGASVLESQRRGGDVVSAAAAWLAGRRAPFFLWAHLYDAHAPYAAPSPFHAAHAARPYDAEVAYVDDCVGQLLEAARAATARLGAGEPLVAVLADHGEALGEHGERTHGFFAYQSTLRVPFLLAGPGIPAGERRLGLARTTDLVPTVLARVGLPLPAGLDGADLLGGAVREAYAETHYPASFGWAPLRSFRMGGLKLVEAPRPELYDLAADPAEAIDLAAARPDAVVRLRDALRALRARERAPAAAVLDPEAAERLRALGYASAGSSPEALAEEGHADPKDRLASYLAFEDAASADVRGDTAAAVAGLRRLVANEPANPVFRRSLVSALRRAGRAAEAAAAIGVPGLERRDAVAWHERAVALAAAGRAKDAEESARSAVRLDPTLPEAHNHLGVLVAGDRPEEGLAHFEAARTLDPNDARAWNNSANALRALGRTDEARQAYEQASRLAPRDPDPLNGLGTLAVEAGRPGDAAAFFRRALQIAPGMAEARLNLAVALAQAGSVHEALAEIARLLAEAPPTALAQRARQLRAELSR